MPEFHPSDRFDLFALLDALGRPPGGPPPSVEHPVPPRSIDSVEGDRSDPEAVMRAALRGDGPGRVFRVKLGYNPNSSSLGTSVVVLLWGIGLAGVLFQMVGAWVLAAREEPPALPPRDEDP